MKAPISELVKLDMKAKSGHARNSQKETEEWLEELAGSLQSS